MIRVAIPRHVSDLRLDTLRALWPGDLPTQAKPCRPYTVIWSSLPYAPKAHAVRNRGSL